MKKSLSGYLRDYAKKLADDIAGGFSNNPLIKDLKPKTMEELIRQQQEEEDPGSTTEVEISAPRQEEEQSIKPTSTPDFKPSREQNTFEKAWVPGTESGKEKRKEYQKEYRSDKMSEPEYIPVNKK